MGFYYDKIIVRNLEENQAPHYQLNKIKFLVLYLTQKLNNQEWQRKLGGATGECDDSGESSIEAKD